MEIKPLIRGICPVCNRTIMNEKKTAYNDYGMAFFTKFDDGSQAEFSICKDCYKTLTQEQADRIISQQIVNWGEDIYKQMLWYSRKAVHLKIVKWNKDKSGL